MAILIVEDENDLSDVLSFLLRRAGYDVILAGDGDAAIRQWRDKSPELVILDINIPKKNGWDVCNTIRSESTTPVIIVSGLDAEEDMVRGFDLGAEDYVVKPFSPRLLQARIKAVLRRSQTPQTTRTAQTSYEVGDFAIDPRWRTATCNERTTGLTRLEHQVLHELALHVGQVVPHPDLIQKIWGYRGETSSDIVKGHIRSVRLKLSEIGSKACIRIVPGVGYLLEV